MLKRFFYLLPMLMILACLTQPETVRAADLNAKAGIVTTSGGRLNVRASASTTGAVAASLGNGSYVTLLSKSGSWWRVEYASGKFGYCHSDYIRATGTAATVTASALNVRSGPSTSHSVTGYLHNGDTAVVLSTSQGWSRILYQGNKLGYVSSKYLSGYYAPIALSLPNFKQNDSRWANVTIGSSGKTFAQIGCATTAIAMIESHRLGRTAMPQEMAQNLRYTPSGSVYWPSHYTVTTNSTDYLSVFYRLLRQGKPILFGAQNTYGTQHWVVVTGFTGGPSLAAEAFTIHDPGTWSRTNLQQFLAAYPRFYKYFTY